MEPTIYRFGDFELDARSQVLRRRSTGEATTLPSRAAATLQCLLDRPGEVLDKRALLAAVWPNVVVEDNNLEQQISLLRQALGERRGDNRYIVTIHGRGYRLVPAVTLSTVADPSGARAPENAAEDASSRGAGSASIPPPTAQRARRARLAALSLAAVLALTAATVAATRFGLRPSDADGTNAPLLAVLPFQPLVPTDRNESLELGMAETLIATLHGPTLETLPLSSVRRYAGAEPDAVAAGRALAADAVLTGSLQRSGRELRVAARLLDVQTRKQLWAERFDVPYEDVLTIQDAIAARVRRALLGDDAASTAARPVTSDAEAYQLYVTGRYHRQQRVDETGLREAIRNFDAAIARDPEFALALVGLAEAQSILGVFGIEPPQEAFPPALAAVERALAVAPDMGEAYTALGHIKAQYELDWQGAERAYRRAIALNPRYAPAHQWYGHYLAYTGRIDEGLESVRRAQALEPTVPALSAVIGMFMNYQRRYDEATRQLERALEMAPDLALAHTYLAVSHLRLGRVAQAEAHLARLRSATPGSVSLAGQLHAVAGRADAARAEAARLIELAKTRYVPAYDVAMIFAAVGDREAALDWLEKAFDERSQLVGWLPWEPVFDALRDDARYLALLAKLPYRRD